MSQNFNIFNIIKITILFNLLIYYILASSLSWIFLFNAVINYSEIKHDEKEGTQS